MFVTDSHEIEAKMARAVYGCLLSDIWIAKDARQLHILLRWFRINAHILTILIDSPFIIEVTAHSHI